MEASQAAPAFRISVTSNRIWTSFSGAIATIFMLAVVLGLVPAVALLTVMQKLSTRTGAALHIATSGQIVLVALLAILFIASNSIAAYAKSICATRWMNAPTLVALSVTAFVGVIAFAVGLQDAIVDLRAGTADDNGKLLIASAVWLWSAWYATAPIFSALLDRLTAEVDLRISA